MEAKQFKGVVLTLGTKKGVFLLTSDKDRSHWQLNGPYLPGDDVNHAILDPCNTTLYATSNNPWFGSRVALSRDLGETWEEKGGLRCPEDSGRTVERLWHLEPVEQPQAGVIYCGGAPGVLFRSDDGGETWTENAALSNHETRERWGPGAGGLCTHSVVVDPENPERMWIAISAAGVFRTEDGGSSWQPMNNSLKNIATKFDPNAELYPEVGQCVHHLVHAAGKNDRLYAQTHYGTYISDDGASTWTDITAGLPSDFGFAMAAHPRNPDAAFVVPLEMSFQRCPPEHKLRVYRTGDAGRSWEPLGNGLPQENAFMGMYREGLCVDSLDPAGVYFGTNTGRVYASADEGESWQRLTVDLPPISSVHAAVLE